MPNLVRAPAFLLDPKPELDAQGWPLLTHGHDVHRVARSLGAQGLPGVSRKHHAHRVARGLGAQGSAGPWRREFRHDSGHGFLVHWPTIKIVIVAGMY